MTFASAAMAPGANPTMPVTVGNQTYNIYRGHVYNVMNVALGIVTLYDPAPGDDGNFTILAPIQSLGPCGNRIVIL
jgi:hypothetical protein